MQSLYQFSLSRKSWGLLALCAFALFAAALYFQHVLGHAPCTKCIYQRTAVIGILIAGLIPLVHNHLLTRLAALCIWAYSAIKGLIVAREHLEIINSDNPFFATCEIFPNFPSFMPLHEWMPAIFSATGQCNDDRWQFLDMGMAAWMQIIFTMFIITLIAVVAAQIIGLIKNKK